MELLLVVATIAVALAFAYTNGFHDASNAIATSVSTRALTPRVALVLAASMNFVGAFLGQRVAETVTEIVEVPATSSGLVVVLAGLLGAIAWNLVTWWLGLPSSSSHALIGGLVGAGMAGGVVVAWSTVVDRVLLPMLLSPLLGFSLAFLLMLALLWSLRRAHAGRVTRRFQLAQTVSASAMALGHGLQDAQKSMGVMVLALVAGGLHADDATIPFWVVLAAATAIGLGTYAGGWRIMRTLGRRLSDLDPVRGFAAESVAATVLYVTAFGAAPVSTTQAISSAIMGAGASSRLSAVRWGVAADMAVAWVLTAPMAGLGAALCYAVLHPLLGA